jgi:hypothetical protein
MLDRELQFVEDGVRCWKLAVEELLATTVQSLLPLIENSCPYFRHENPRSHFSSDRQAWHDSVSWN